MWGKALLCPIQVPYLNTSMYSPTRKLSEPCLFSGGVIDYIMAIGDCQPPSLSSPQSWGQGCLWLKIQPCSLTFSSLETSPHLQGLSKSHLININSGTSLVIQWLRLCTSSVGGVGWICGTRNKISYASWCGQKNPINSGVVNRGVVINNKRHLPVLLLRSSQRFSELFAQNR